MKSRSLKVGAFQFATTENIETNLKSIKRGIELAAKENVRLLLTQECALCGYPPVEIPSVDSIDLKAQSEAIEEILALSKQHDMYIALGVVSSIDENTYNSIQFITPRCSDNRVYHKRALWGWDTDNFKPGKELGIYFVDDIKVALRICYEVRFPEYFRELFRNEVDLCLVSFADIGTEEQKEKIGVIRAHLVSRATENVMYVLSANSTSQYQLAPTCLINPDGIVLEKAPINEEALIAREIEFLAPHFGQKGRIIHSKKLLGNGA